MCIARGFYRYMCARLHVGFITRLYVLQMADIYDEEGEGEGLGSGSDSPVWNGVLTCCATYTLMLVMKGSL